MEKLSKGLASHAVVNAMIAVRCSLSVTPADPGERCRQKDVAGKYNRNIYGMLNLIGFSYRGYLRRKVLYTN